MQQNIRLLLVCFLTGMCSLTNIQSCSRIFLNNKGETIVITRTMDWDVDDDPELWLYPRGMTVDGKAGKNSLSWVSKYGSLAIKTWKDAIVDGINEHGLSVNLLYLKETEYEVRDDRPGVSTAQWVRYFLDNFATVKEALAGLNDFQLVSVKIDGEYHPLHISMEDATGDSAIVEYVNGELVVYHGVQYRIMTNGPTYDRQLKNTKQYKGLGGILPLPGDIGSVDRFVRASYFMRCLPKTDCALEVVAYAFSLIYNVSTPYGTPYGGQDDFEVCPTWWITVADLTNKVYYFKSTKNFHTAWVDIKNLNFAHGSTPMRLVPKNAKFAGEISVKFKLIL